MRKAQVEFAKTKRRLPFIERKVIFFLWQVILGRIMISTGTRKNYNVLIILSASSSSVPVNPALF